MRPEPTQVVLPAPTPTAPEFKPEAGAVAQVDRALTNPAKFQASLAEELVAALEEDEPAETRTFPFTFQAPLKQELKQESLPPQPPKGGSLSSKRPTGSGPPPYHPKGGSIPSQRPTVGPVPSVPSSNTTSRQVGESTNAALQTPAVSDHAAEADSPAILLLKDGLVPTKDEVHLVRKRCVAAVKYTLFDQPICLKGAVGAIQIPVEVLREMEANLERRLEEEKSRLKEPAISANVFNSVLSPWTSFVHTHLMSGDDPVIKKGVQMENLEKFVAKWTFQVRRLMIQKKETSRLVAPRKDKRAA